MSEGANRLARVLDGRMKTLGARLPALDYGIILEGMGLRLDGFPVPVPEPDYVKCRSALDARPGDRVLVAWVGGDATVVDIIYRED